MSDQPSSDQSQTRVATVSRRGALVENGLPLFTSLLLHAALLGVGLLTYQSVKLLMQRQVQTVAGDTPLITPAIMTGLDDGFRGDQNNRTLQPRQDQFDDPAANGWTRDRGTDRQSLSDSFNADSNSQADAEALIGIGPRTARVGHDQGASGEGGPLAPFDGFRPGGGSNLFRPGMTGTQRPRSEVFLCDASGSMLPKFHALLSELSKAIQALQPVQSFSIHFFSDTRAISLSPQLLMATPGNKLHALDFLENVTPRGSTDPIPSLELAFKQRPQLIFLLTDGDFPDNAAVLNRIRQLEKDHPIKINTIAFVGEGDSDTAFLSVLQQIARETGGVYRHVTEDELR
jgi:hypothetical protein